MKLTQLHEARIHGQVGIPPELHKLIQFFEKVETVNYESGKGSNWKVKDGFSVRRAYGQPIGGLDIYPNEDYTFVDQQFKEISVSVKDVIVDKTERVYP